MKTLAAIGLAFILTIIIGLLCWWAIETHSKYIGFVIGTSISVGYYFNDIVKWFNNK